MDKITQDIIKLADLLSKAYNVNYDIDLENKCINVIGYKNLDDVTNFYNALERQIVKIYSQVDVENLQ